MVSPLSPHPLRYDPAVCSLIWPHFSAPLHFYDRHPSCVTHSLTTFRLRLTATVLNGFSLRDPATVHFSNSPSALTVPLFQFAITTSPSAVRPPCSTCRSEVRVYRVTPHHGAFVARTTPLRAHLGTPRLGYCIPWVTVTVSIAAAPSNGDCASPMSSIRPFGSSAWEVR